jgi:hypothetical protein
MIENDERVSLGLAMEYRHNERYMKVSTITTSSNACSRLLLVIDRRGP